MGRQHAVPAVAGTGRARTSVGPRPGNSGRGPGGGTSRGCCGRNEGRQVRATLRCTHRSQRLPLVVGRPLRGASGGAGATGGACDPAAGATLARLARYASPYVLMMLRTLASWTPPAARPMALAPAWGAAAQAASTACRLARRWGPLTRGMVYCGQAGRVVHLSLRVTGVPWGHRLVAPRVPATSRFFLGGGRDNLCPLPS